MWLAFIQLKGFTSELKHFHLTDDDLRDLENELIKNPEAGSAVAQTGGLRKIRFAPPSRHSGKSGAYRVCYVYFRVAQTIVLLSIFAKSEQENLTAEQKVRFRTLIAMLKKQSEE